MKTTILAVLMTALSIGVSPLGIMSASAQDASVIKKKGATQTGQSDDVSQPHPNASGAQGAQSEAGAATGGEQAQQLPTGSDRSTGKPTDGAAGNTQAQPDASTRGRTAPVQSGVETKPDDSGNGAAQGSDMKPGGTSGTYGSKPSTETQKPGSPDSGTSSEARKSGDGSNRSSGLTETQTKTRTDVENSDKSVNRTAKKTTNVNISVEQRTEIRQVVNEVHFERVREVNFTVSLGTAIPKKIRLEPLPPRIGKIVPQYETYRFFILADGRIVIVDPTANTIVYIITA